jgi:hypothetical protein
VRYEVLPIQESPSLEICFVAHVLLSSGVKIPITWPRIIIRCLTNKEGTLMLFFYGCLGSLLAWQDALAVWEALLERGRSKL